MIYIDGHPTSIPDSVGFPIIIILLLFWALPSLYNFWILYAKAKKPGWAVLIPIYGPIVAAQIGKKPVYIGVIFGIVSIFQFSSDTTAAYIVAAIQTVLLVSLGLVLVSGLSKQYKASKGFWISLILLPIVAYRNVNLVKYSPKKVS